MILAGPLMGCHVGGFMVCALWNRSHERGASHVMLRQILLEMMPCYIYLKSA